MGVCVTKTTLNPEAALERTLLHLVQRLREVGGENLLGIALYGVPAHQRTGVKNREINLLVVLSNASLPALLPLAAILSSAQRQSQVASVVVTPADLRAEAQLFPGRILEIRRSHRLLHGDVALDRLEISPHGLRFAALQDLKNLEDRLRHRIVNHGTDPDLLWSGFVQSLVRLASILETVLYARHDSLPAERSEMLRLAAGELGVEPGRVESLAALRPATRRPPDDTVRETLGDYLHLLADLVQNLGRAIEAGGPPATGSGWDG
jgi:hypothetical protein